MDTYQAPGPIFTPEPGWGGKIHVWLRKYFWQFVLPGLLIAVFLILTSQFNWQPRLVSSSPTATPLPAVLSRSIAPGESRLLVIRQIVSAYIAQQTENLTGGQRIFMETKLNQILPADSTLAGQIQIPLTALATISQQAKTLSPSQLAQWENYARNIRF